MPTCFSLRLGEGFFVLPIQREMRTRLMSSQQVSRTMDRLAHEIVERNRGVESVSIVGIKNSGAVLARELVKHINQVENTHVPTIDLDVTGYRDDQPFAEGDGVLADLTDRDVILVDDVLFTGRTARAALDAVVRSGRPRSIQLLVLIDRGHREYPIQPDYVGKVLPTKHRERIEVNATDLLVEVVE